jgi:hypothetical protein
MGGGLYIPKNGILSKFNLRVRGELRNLLKIRLFRLVSEDIGLDGNVGLLARRSGSIRRRVPLR